MPNRFFAVNSPEVSQEIIDGEVVAIALKTGSYYSITGTGAEIWEMLVVGTSPAMVTETLLARYDVEPARLLEEVTDFISSLLGEALIVELTSAQAAQTRITGLQLPTERLPFSKPLFERFDDMKEMLILDPIHDVSESGWPFVNDKKVGNS